jgi:4-hydroxythreonine-4-phosphate dehydrogenase
MPPTRTLRIAITAGEPAGIGPELIAAVAQREWAAELVVLGDPALLHARAAAVGRGFDAAPFDPGESARAGRIACLAIPLNVPSKPGRLDLGNARHVLDMLAVAADGAEQRRFDAIVTAPVHKGVLNDAGFAFTGHTEFFAQRANADVVMLLAAPGLRVALATTHLPLRAVADAIDGERIERCLRVLHAALVRDFGIPAPRIDVLGLNPHAGEGGHLGREEIEHIAPAMARLRAIGMDLRGPLPADTAFLPDRLAHTDALLAMYHDQGLPALKTRGFGEAVNITLGLPYVRTSVDHGTALDLAGSGRADPSSLIEATRQAIAMADQRHRAA